MKTNSEVVPINNTLIQVISNLRKGALLTEASEELQILTQAVKEHGKPGKFTLTLKISPQGNGDVVVVTDDIEVKAPKSTPLGSVFYTTDEGLLTREDPNQKEMNLGVVERPAAPPVTRVVAKVSEVLGQDETPEAVNQ